MSKAFLLLLLVVTALPLSAQERAPTTVILVRHAEKAAAPADDPPLTEAGQARARALMAITRDAGVTAIITTQFVRTRETARPSAVALKIAPEIIRATAGAQHVQDVARAALAHTGGVVLVVGHSNTVPAIIAALGAPPPPPICDNSYDDLYVVTIPASGAARVIHARYGEPSPATEGCASMMR
ncbi:MAG TPA: phosphoglycerate mutase family protein [Gemmatimonadaceae bacterium]|nr:phosphoglycerate mutase family protein [Gemmatimonadaceae bacterium]